MKLYVAFVLLALIGCSMTESVDRATVCRLPTERGPCAAYFVRYAYNFDKKACVKFVYGGCQGNDNNFESFEDCRKYCENL